MQHMPHDSPGSQAVIVFSERELTFTFAIMLSPVRLSVVCNVRAPYSFEIFSNGSMSFGTLAIH